MALTVGSFLAACKRLLLYRWQKGKVRRALSDRALERLLSYVTATDQFHTGRIRICTESALPWTYLLRGATSRERALMLFSKQRVWDTEHNNGVLIYLLLPDHAIEIVADRGLAQYVPANAWEADVWQTAQYLREGRFEDGLAHAIRAVSDKLIKHFPSGHIPKSD